jgi:hypothetical protein
MQFEAKCPVFPSLYAATLVLDLRLGEFAMNDLRMFKMLRREDALSSALATTW